MLNIPPRQQVQYPTVAYIRKGKPKVKLPNKDGNGTYEALAPHSDLKDKFRIHFLPGTSIAKEIWNSRHEKELVKYPENSTAPNGYEVQQLRVIVPAQSVWNAWRHGNTANNTGREIARADDERYWTLRDPLTGAYIVREGEPYKKYSIGDAIHYERNGKQYELKLKTNGQLRLVCADMVEQGQLVEFVLKTTSFYDCQNIKAQLQGIQNIADTVNNGNAAGIPLVIYRMQQEVTWNKPDGSASRVPQWLVNIQADPLWVKHIFSRMGQLALTSGATAYLPPSKSIEGVVEPIDDDASDIVDEDEVHEFQGVVVGEEPLTPPLPSSTEELKRVFAKEFNEALKVVTKGTKLPSITPNSDRDQIKEAIAGVRAAVAAAS